MKFAYADPPYLGCASFYKGMHPDWAVWDEPETHRNFIATLCDDYPDGWAMSLHTPSLRTILPMCPEDCRVAAWVKPFCSFKPGVGVAYAWEPVIFRGGRKRPRGAETTRDWCAVNITLRKGFTGAKPAEFVQWIMDVLHVQPGDVVNDLFPGSGGCSDVIAARLMPRPSIADMFAGAA
jgi:hypothetical protein